MDVNITNLFKHHVGRTRAIVAEIRVLKKKDDPTEADIGRLIELRDELTNVAPSVRFFWIDGKPAIDIIAELVAIGSGDPDPAGSGPIIKQEGEK